MIESWWCQRHLIVKGHPGGLVAESRTDVRQKGYVLQECYLQEQKACVNIVMVLVRCKRLGQYSVQLPCFREQHQVGHAAEHAAEQL